MKKLTALMLLITIGSFTLFAQTKTTHPKLTLTNIKNGLVILDEQDDFKNDRGYTVELHFSNSIAKIERKEPISLTLDNKPNNRFVLLDYEIPLLSSSKSWNYNKWGITLDTIIAINYWDSTHQVEDINNPGAFYEIAKIMYFRIDNWMAEDYKTFQLHVPPGTFTDIYGNKNDEINITYQRRKK